MPQPHLNLKRTLVTLTLLVSLFLTACNSPTSTQPQSKTFKVGIITNSPNLTQVIDNFKVGMAELGYVEGKNLSYQFKGLTKPEELEAEAKNLMDAKVDVIIAIGTAPARATKAATAGTEIPVVFAPGADPVKLGFVKSMANPEGNLTGIATGYQYPTRALEYLLKIVPKAKRVLLFHSPSETSIPFLPPSQEAATKLGLELIVQTVKTGDELTAALGNIPADVDAMLYLPDTLVGARFDDVLKAAFSHKIPVVAGDKYKVENGALLAYGWDYVALGKQTAALTDKVLKGTKPAALAIETTEFFLSANLKTAGSIGLNIPDDVLRQATTIVR